MEFNQTGYGSTPNGAEYWSNHRSKLSDLYRSEKHFFVSTIQQADSILDLGCAAGGSLCFSREAKPGIHYTGIDISEDLIKKAQKRFSQESDAQFMQFDGKTIPLKDLTVDFSFSFGVFHHLNDWKEMAKELLRVSKRYVLFDIRLWEGSSLVGSPLSYQKIALGEVWDGKTIIQYNIQSFTEVFNFLTEQKNQNTSSFLYGYYAPPTEFATTPAKKVLMLAILLEKNSSTPGINLTIE